MVVIFVEKQGMLAEELPLPPDYIFVTSKY